MMSDGPKLTHYLFVVFFVLFVLFVPNAVGASSETVKGRRTRLVFLL